MSTTTREENLLRVEVVSETEHRRLLDMRGRGDLFFVPDPTSLYVVEMEVTRDRGDSRDRHSWTQLYVSEDVADEAACEMIKEWYASHPYMKDNDDARDVLRAVAEHRVADALARWRLRMSSMLDFKLRTVEVRGNPLPHKIAPPEEA